jgi:hypothetical protein
MPHVETAIAERADVAGCEAFLYLSFLPRGPFIDLFHGGSHISIMLSLLQVLLDEVLSSCVVIVGLLLFMGLHFEKKQCMWSL